VQPHIGASTESHLHNNFEDRWLTQRLKLMGLDEPGMGWHAFRRGFAVSGAKRTSTTSGWGTSRKQCQNSIHGCMRTLNELRLAEAETVGYGFDLPANPSKRVVLASTAPRKENVVLEKLAASA